MKTYVIEDCNGSVLGYTKRLKDAKRNLETNVKRGHLENDIRIIMIQGQYFGEGFHKYILTYKNGKYKREKV